MAVRIGTAADMKGMTYSAMLAVCERAEALATVSAFGGGRDRKEEEIEALGDYMRALDREPTLFFHHRSLIKDLSRKVKRNLRKKNQNMRTGPERRQGALQVRAARRVPQLARQGPGAGRL